MRRRARQLASAGAAISVREGACAAFKSRFGARSDDSAFYCARVGRKEVGQIELDDDGENVQVNAIHVDENFQRRGVATKLYEAAAIHACQYGTGLRSDINRSEEAEGFWRKQYRKGRARAILAVGADELEEYREQGYDVDDVQPDSFDPSEIMYEIKDCGKIDLSGLALRRRRTR